MSTRLIETWLPIAELGIKSVRERTPMTPFPAPNRLHVWWARWPLVASRAAVLASLLPADADPYAVTPEGALDAARREVKRWRLEQITRRKAHSDLDPLTAWFVLAWDAFEAPQFPYDEALRLARVAGLDMDAEIIGVLAEKKASDVILWDSQTRAAKGRIGPVDGRKAMLDALHHAVHLARSRALQTTREFIETSALGSEPAFLAVLAAVLEVLPPSGEFTGVDPLDAVKPAADDFGALENLRRLLFNEQVPAPEQLKLWA